MSHIAIIVGSTRPVRVGDQIAEQIAQIVTDADGTEVRILDLVDFGLPLLDEPVMAAATSEYAHEHTRRWSEAIREAGAVIFLTPQYNAGYPAGLKNAIDYLYSEWRNKPGLIVSYGGHGGSQAAAQLEQVLGRLGIAFVSAPVAITLSRDAYRAGRLADPAQAIAGSRDELASATRALSAALRN